MILVYHRVHYVQLESTVVVEQVLAVNNVALVTSLLVKDLPPAHRVLSVNLMMILDLPHVHRLVPQEHMVAVEQLLVVYHALLGPFLQVKVKVLA